MRAHPESTSRIDRALNGVPKVSRFALMGQAKNPELRSMSRADEACAEEECPAQAPWHKGEAPAHVVIHFGTIPQRAWQMHLPNARETAFNQKQGDFPALVGCANVRQRKDTTPMPPGGR